jgi:hypothetical protein
LSEIEAFKTELVQLIEQKSLPVDNLCELTINNFEKFVLNIRFIVLTKHQGSKELNASLDRYLSNYKLLLELCKKKKPTLETKKKVMDDVGSMSELCHRIITEIISGWSSKFESCLEEFKGNLGKRMTIVCGSYQECIDIIYQKFEV